MKLFNSILLFSSILISNNSAIAQEVTVTNNFQNTTIQTQNDSIISMLKAMDKKNQAQITNLQKQIDDNKKEIADLKVIDVAFFSNNGSAPSNSNLFAQRVSFSYKKTYGSADFSAVGSKIVAGPTTKGLYLVTTLNDCTDENPSVNEVFYMQKNTTNNKAWQEGIVGWTEAASSMTFINNINPGDFFILTPVMFNETDPAQYCHLSRVQFYKLK